MGLGDDPALCSLAEDLGQPYNWQCAASDYIGQNLPRLNAKPHGDRIGGLEADPTDVAGKPIGIFGHDLDGIGTIDLVDSNSACGADPMAVQKHHDLAHNLLFRPGGGDAARA